MLKLLKTNKYSKCIFPNEVQQRAAKFQQLNSAAKFQQVCKLWYARDTSCPVEGEFVAKVLPLNSGDYRADLYVAYM